MTIDEAVRTYLLTVTTLTNQVGTRIYPATLEPSARVYPYLLYAELNRTYGNINTKKNYVKYYQFTVYSQNFDTTQIIKEALLDAFESKPNVQYTGIGIVKGRMTGCGDFPYDAVLNVYGAHVDIKIDYIKT